MSIETDGDPGSGRYPKGSGENSSDKVTPDKSKQRLNFKRTGNMMHMYSVIDETGEDYMYDMDSFEITEE